MSVRRTAHQKMLMSLILGAATRGQWLDFTELQSEVVRITGVVTTKQALQCALKALIADGHINKVFRIRRERKRSVLIPTKKGFDYFAPITISPT